MTQPMIPVADALALAASLQDEIERLKGYTVHKPECAGYYGNAACSCGLTPETGAT